MASIFTGLAFMHGHIVDRELVMRLGREEPSPGAGTGAGAGAGAEARVTRPRKARPKAMQAPPAHTACASCC